jgi:hypothetical protein
METNSAIGTGSAKRSGSEIGSRKSWTLSGRGRGLGVGLEEKKRVARGYAAYEKNDER